MNTLVITDLHLIFRFELEAQAAANHRTVAAEARLILRNGVVADTRAKQADPKAMRAAVAFPDEAWHQSADQTIAPGAAPFWDPLS